MIQHRSRTVEDILAGSDLNGKLCTDIERQVFEDEDDDRANRRVDGWVRRTGNYPKNR